jgi:hypothetical protein
MTDPNGVEIAPQPLAILREATFAEYRADTPNMRLPVTFYLDKFFYEVSTD